MKKTLLTLLLLTAIGATAQQRTVRIAYVDMEYILQNVPEYQEASAQLDTKVQKWKTEIETELTNVEAMRQSLENEKPLLTAELIAEREEEIEFEQQKLQAYQQKRFGPQGDLMTQKLQLVQPIQDQVFNAVQEIAANRKYDMIFDKSADVVMLYASESLDISEQVLRMITRAAGRQQADTRSERQEIQRQENLSVEQEQAIDQRDIQKEEAQNDRKALLEQRRKDRDSIKAAKQQAFDERRAKILQERQAKKDSIRAAREAKKEND